MKIRTRELKISAATTAIAIGAIAAAQGAGGGGPGQSAGSGGGGSATAEAEIRMYLAIAGAANDVGSQLDQWSAGKKVSGYILYNPTLVSDINICQTVKAPLDSVWLQIRERSGGNGGHGMEDAAAFPWSLFSNLSLANIFSASPIATFLTATTTASGVGGPTDADSFIASHLITHFENENSSVKIFAPSVFPMTLPPPGQIKLCDDPTKIDPLTEITFLQQQLFQSLKAIQWQLAPLAATFIQATSTEMNGASAPKGAVADAYTKLKTDLGTLTGPPVLSPPPSSAPPTPPALDLVKQDIANLKALLASSSDPMRVPLGALSSGIEGATGPTFGTNPANHDYLVQILQQLNIFASTLGATITNNGTAGTMAPSAGSVDTVANILTRGWEILSHLKCGAKLLRIRMEISQGTDKNSSYMWSYIHDSSATALLSFMVFGDPTCDSSVEFSSWALAYYPFQNADNATNIDSLRIMEPGGLNPNWTWAGHLKGDKDGDHIYILPKKP